MSSKLQAIWKTKRPIQILDLENDYFSVKFHENEDYLAALSGGLWTILGQYLMVRPWTPTFMTDQSLPKNLMVWICLPGLLEEILTVCVDLRKPLILKIRVEERIQQVLPMVCVDCGRYGHYKKVCPHKARQEADPTVEEDKSPKVATVLHEEFKMPMNLA
ncbi:hypothetical protein GOBAR_AA21498 [Gossypium barbadense]|uniref:CCHC-type domain-containing protein n=1 Tax=Gossypium barbadense TaxID=3634 RepID=A0A2P5X773_GOSBA|nr:hypothetical protein GOBAR_AA21498 [Gossypium barbadense]